MPPRLCGEASALVESHDKIRALSLAHLNVAGGGEAVTECKTGAQGSVVGS